MMKKLLAGTAWCLVECLGLCLIPSGSGTFASSPYSNLVVFGDSLSDNGNIPKIVPPALLTGTASAVLPLPPYYDFHFSNGPIYAEKLGPLLGIASQLSDSAVGGAYSGPLHETIGSQTLSGVNISPQLNALSLPNNGSGVIIDTSVEGQIQAMIARGASFNRNALYVVWGGANDYFSLFNSLLAQAATLSLAQVTGAISQQVGTTISNLSTDVTLLAQSGARSIVVPTLPNLGGTPSFNGSALTAQLGQLASASHDSALASAMGSLGRKFGVNIFLIDTASLFQDLETHPGKYGLVNVTSACLQNGVVCAAPNSTLFWDQVHPTTVVQSIFADAVASTVEAPMVIGAQGKIADIATGMIFDGISSRVAALQQGASGFTLVAPGGADAHIASNDPLSLYVTGGYGRNSRNDSVAESGFVANSGTIQAGADYRADQKIAFGAQVGFTTISATLKDDMGSDDLRSYSLALYGATFGENWYGSLSGFYAYQDWDKLNRNTLVVGQVAGGSSSGTVIGSKLEAGYLLHEGGYSFGPTADFRIAHVTINAYSEQGAVGLNQEVDNQSYNAIIGELGGKVATDLTIGGTLVRPSLQIGWDHQYNPTQRHVFSRLASLPEATIDTALPGGAGDWARVGLGVSVLASNSLSVVADIDGTVGRADGQDVGGLVKLLFKF
jgi:phospholipase/lecithinase/hemolysin/uncharacterized protein YhjY with autotransporter beta-barrel domain